MHTWIKTSEFLYHVFGELNTSDVGDFRPIFLCSALEQARNKQKYIGFYDRESVYLAATMANYYISDILASTLTRTYTEHLAALGVPARCYYNFGWMQRRRRELLRQMISHFEAIGD